MKHTLSHGVLSQLSEMIAAKTALHFPEERWGDLEQKVGSSAKEFGFSAREEFIQWLLSSPITTAQMNIIASHLTIHETYFWREPQVFEALVTQVLPEFVRSRKSGDKRLRIWSAGCATGEEPFSIAIALRKAIPALENWQITILATDINPRILRKAMAGVYSKWSFRNAPPWLIDGYFNCKKDGVFEILPEIRKMVTFTYLNLAEDNYPSSLNNTNAMDIIFCRNVLMYFGPERAKQVGQNLFRSLVNGGWLMVSASELSQHLFPQFASVKFPGAIVYRKSAESSDRVEQPPLSFRFHEDEKTEAVVYEFPVRIEPVAVLEQPPQAAGLQTIGKTAEETPQSKAISIRSLADQGKLPEAFALCEEALASGKLDPRLHFLRAIILQELNRIDEACVSLKRTLYLDRNFVMAHFALGNIAMQQGKAPVAKKHFENVLTILKANRPEDILPESEGLTAGRFREIIRAIIETGALV